MEAVCVHCGARIQRPWAGRVWWRTLVSLSVVCPDNPAGLHEADAP